MRVAQIVVLLLACAANDAWAGSTAVISVDVVGAKALKGNIICRLFDEDRWLDDELARAETTPDEPRITFASRPSGRYAVACFHDSDKNGKLTFGWFWRPKEGSGFSNAYVPTGPPRFKRAAFEADGATTVRVLLTYP